MSTTLVTMRQYARVSNDHTERITINIDPDGYIRMTADNLHDVLTHLGFARTDQETTT